MQVHPAQISPGEAFDVFYFLRNWTDEATYYVQAKIYDVRTGELLDTFELPQSATNSRLFITTRTAPPDPTGYGRNIVAIATVYTDSGFTSKSENYEEQEQYFLVKSAMPFVGGGSGVDYRVIEDIVAEQLKKAIETLPKPEKLSVPDAPDMSFVEALFGHLGVIERELGRIPKTEADLSAITRSVDAVKEALDQRPQFEKTDLSALSEDVKSLLAALNTIRTELQRRDAQLLQVFDASLESFAKKYGATIQEQIKDAIQTAEISLPLFGGRTPRNESDPVRSVKSLTGA